MKIIILLIALLLPAAAESLRTANVTAAINEVKVYEGEAASRSATLGERVALPTSVQTGRRSRAELTFNDSTITRLGQNSVFDFRDGGRNVELKQGSVLLQVPKNAGGATIRTATVTAAITGTTVIFEYNPGKWVKLITLEGTLKLSINGGKKTVSLPAGQMIVMHPNAKEIPNPVTIDIAKLLATSLLVGHGNFGPLPQKATELIEATIQNQLLAKRTGDLVPARYLISGVGSWSVAGIVNSSQHNRFHLNCGCASGFKK